MTLPGPTPNRTRFYTKYSTPFIIIQSFAIFILLVAITHVLTIHIWTMSVASNPLYLLLETIELLLMLIPPLILLYWNKHLHNDDQPFSVQWVTVKWLFIGTAAILSVILALRLHHYLLAMHIEPRLFIMELITGTGIGSILGFSVGRFRAEKEFHANKIQDQRDAFLFLNRVLRHHVLNSLQLIDGYASHLAQFDDPDLKQIEHILREQSDHVTNLVSNVRMIVRTFTNDPSFEPVNLTSVAAMECRNMERFTENVSIEFENSEAIFVKSNSLLQAVIRDLLQNAIEHSDRDHTRISVSVERRAETARLLIADNGPGIPDPEKTTLLTTGDSGDRGTGLYLINRIITQQGGTLGIRDNEPRGTIVEIELQRTEK